MSAPRGILEEPKEILEVPIPDAPRILESPKNISEAPREIVVEQPREVPEPARQPQAVPPRWYKVFVYHIPSEFSRQDLQEQYQRIGRVVEAHIVTELLTGRSRGFGYVKFGSYEEATSAIANSPEPMRAHWAVLSSTKSLNDLRNDPRFNYVFTSTFSGNGTLLVDNLSPFVSKKDNDKLLKLAFGKYGTVRNVNILASNKSAYVIMASSEAATLAILDRDGKPLCSVGARNPYLTDTITVKWANLYSHRGSSNRMRPYRAPNPGYGILGPAPVHHYTDASFSAPGPARLRPRLTPYGYNTSPLPWFPPSAIQYNLESASVNLVSGFNNSGIGAVRVGSYLAHDLNVGVGYIDPVPYVDPTVYGLGVVDYMGLPMPLPDPAASGPPTDFP